MGRELDGSRRVEGGGEYDKNALYKTLKELIKIRKKNIMLWNIRLTSWGRDPTITLFPVFSDLL